MELSILVQSKEKGGPLMLMAPVTGNFPENLLNLRISKIHHLVFASIVLVLLPVLCNAYLFSTWDEMHQF